MLPTHYTTREGGQWIPWEKGEITEEELEIRDHVKVVFLKELLVHSLKNDEYRWDCISGMRKKGN